jgi:hypothetical protein
MPITQSMLPGLVESNARSGDVAFETGSKLAQEKLKNYLASQSQEKSRAAGVEMLRQLKQDNPDLINSGGSVSVNPDTGQISAGANPYASLLKSQQKGEEGARQLAIKSFNSAAPKLQDTAGTIQSLVGAINNPDVKGWQGVVQGLGTRLNGVTRYNDAEGKAITPTTVAENLMGELNKFDPNNPTSTASLAAKRNILAIAGDHLDSLNTKFATTKADALQHYQLSGFNNPDTAAMMEKQLGAGLGSQLQTLSASVKANRDALGSNSPPKGLLGYFKGMVPGFNAPKSTPAQPQTPNPAAPPPIDFDAEDKRRAALKVQQPQPQQPPQGQ